MRKKSQRNSHAHQMAAPEVMPESELRDFLMHSSQNEVC